jgi:hypothetical protein
MSVCLCGGEDVDAAQDYHPVLPFCTLCVGEMLQVSELGSCKEVSVGPNIQSHRAPTRAADEMRLGFVAPVHPAPDARALHHMPEAAGRLCLVRFQRRRFQHERADGARVGAVGHGKRGDALAVGRQFVNFPAAVCGGNGIDPFGLEVGEIFEAMGSDLGLEELDEVFRHFALIVAVASVRGDLPEGFGEGGILEHVA